MIGPRFLSKVLLLLPLAVMGCGADSNTAGSPTVRIGYQKAGTLNLMRLRGTLKPELDRLGVSIEWVGFSAGPLLLEALNAGSIDFGMTGDTPPILAQAAGVPFVYVAYEPRRPRSEAILVPTTSPLKSVADLRGHKVAFNKGSNVHYFLVRALEAAGLGYKDVQPVFLPPSDARAAFVGGSVDAWVTWDPYFAEAEINKVARVLADGDGVAANREFHLASRKFAQDHPDVIRALIKAIGTEGEWATAHKDKVSEILAAEMKIDLKSVQRMIERRVYGITAMDDAVVAEQQQIADTFASLGLIPRPVSVREAVLTAAPSLADQRSGKPSPESRGQ